MDSIRECSIGECSKPLLARGMCGMHWRRNKVHGDPNWDRAKTGAVSFASRINKTGSCWLWTGGIHPESGYGFVQVANKRLQAHRRSYELYVGPIPEGLQIDHLCRVRACVNPDHLEAVTGAENLRRAGRYLVHGTCKWGHAINKENLFANSQGFLGCLTCYTARNKRPRRKLEEVFGHGIR